MQLCEIFAVYLYLNYCILLKIVIDFKSAAPSFEQIRCGSISQYWPVLAIVLAIIGKVLSSIDKY
jgi:hypothetical protein